MSNFQLTLDVFLTYTPFVHWKVMEHDPKANPGRPIHLILQHCLTCQKHWHQQHPPHWLRHCPRHPKGCRVDVSNPKWWNYFGTYGVPKFLLWHQQSSLTNVKGKAVLSLCTLQASSVTRRWHYQMENKTNVFKRGQISLYSNWWLKSWISLSNKSRIWICISLSSWKTS